MSLNSTVASKITMHVLRDGQIKSQRVTHNIMTDYGLQSWAQGNLGSHIALGSGSRAEAGNITTLADYVRTQSGSYSYSESNVIDEVAGVMRSDHTLAVTFPIETENRNYSEMGIHNNSINQLQTYALIRDALEQPTAQTVLAGEQLRVYYTVQFSVPLQHVEQRVMSGVPTTVTTVPIYTGQSVSARLPATSSNRMWEAGQPVPAAGIVPSGSVSAPSATRTGNQSRVFLSDVQGNLTGGISMLQAGSGVSSISLLVHFDPPIQKTSDYGANLITTSTLANGVYHES